MKKIVLCGCFCLTLSFVFAQKLWTENDRQYLLDHLKKTTDALEKETTGLTEAQWHFKESPGRWSIAQVIEHLGIYESLYNREATVITNSTPQPELNETVKSDTFFLEWMAETQPHVAGGLGLPQGLMHGADNWKYFKNLRDQNVAFIQATNADLRAHFTYRSGNVRWSIHQLYIILFAHCDRHLKQILKVKADAAYPKS